MDPSTTWSCEQCSTINRGSTSKCSFCGTLKSYEPSRKSPGSVGGRKHRSRPAVVTQHISTHTTVIDDSVTQDNRQLEPSIKWTCMLCSYKNWPNATKCVMCNKRRNSTSLSRSAEDMIGAVGGPELLSSEEQCKWKCSRCTYENWPRSSKCTLCHSSKPSSPPLTPLISAVASEEGSSLSQCSVDINELQTKVQLLSTSDKMKQIRNKMNETDWLFLNACVGVVNNDLSAVQSYIQATAGNMLYVLCILATMLNCNRWREGSAVNQTRSNHSQ